MTDQSEARGEAFVTPEEARRWLAGEGPELRAFDVVHSLAAQLEEAQERERQPREALRRISEQQPSTMAVLRKHGFVFDTPLGKPDEERTEAERWEKAAFTIYTDLCEVDSIARAALDSTQTHGGSDD